MKVVALLETSISAGGGFNQALNAIVQMARLADGNFDFTVLTSKPENVNHLERLNIAAETFKPTILDQFIAVLTGNEIGRRIQTRLQLIGPLEKKLMSMGCDLVYFVAPSVLPVSLQCLNYIVTVWDGCHRDFPEFPEVRAFGQFHHREFIYKNYLTSAYLVLVDSEQLRDRIHGRYAVDKERIIVMPFAPNPMLENDCSATVDNVLNHYNLQPGYFFYPAQFWAHKNHVRILEALAILRDQGKLFHFVFSGGNLGNRDYIEQMICSLDLGAQISILGFVPSDHLRGLYQACSAVVMPTYFGPTNLPPLEAWAMGKPLIYSCHLAEQSGKAALLVDPDNARSIADALIEVQNATVVERLGQYGRSRLLEFSVARGDAEQRLEKILNQFAHRRRCWGTFAK